MVAMTAHASPELAIPKADQIPESTIYIVKAQISSISELIKAIEESISKSEKPFEAIKDVSDKIVITGHQAEILKNVGGWKVKCLYRQRTWHHPSGGRGTSTTNICCIGIKG
jgi:hypothetical protein